MRCCSGLHPDEVARADGADGAAGAAAPNVRCSQPVPIVGRGAATAVAGSGRWCAVRGCSSSTSRRSGRIGMATRACWPSCDEHLDAGTCLIAVDPRRALRRGRRDARHPARCTAVIVSDEAVSMIRAAPSAWTNGSASPLGPNRTPDEARDRVRLADRPRDDHAARAAAVITLVALAAGLSIGRISVGDLVRALAAAVVRGRDRGREQHRVRGRERRPGGHRGRPHRPAADHRGGDFGRPAPWGSGSSRSRRSAPSSR